MNTNRMTVLLIICVVYLGIRELAAAKRHYDNKEKQGRGLGRKAMTAILDHIRTFPCGKDEYVWLSYEPENTDSKELSAVGYEIQSVTPVNMFPMTKHVETVLKLKRTV